MTIAPELIKVATRILFGTRTGQIAKAITKKGLKSVATKKALKKFLIKAIKRKLLSRFNIIIDWKKYGFKYVAKQFALHKLPLEIQRAYFTYYSLVGKSKTKAKKKFWKEIDKKEDKVKVVKALIKTHPTTKEEKERVDNLLNETFWFNVNSPETHNFSQLPHHVNIYQKVYGLPIRSGIFPNYMKYYQYYFTSRKKTLMLMEKAITTDNFGKEVYSKIRSPIPPHIKILLKNMIYKRL